MAYAPPKGLQDKSIWTLTVLNGNGKIPEHYYTKGKVPLLTWPDVQRRYRLNPHKYAPVVGVISKDLIVFDIDHHEEIPFDFPETLSHRSKSGTGWRIYYYTEQPLPKKVLRFDWGEVYNGAFVTTTDPDLTNFSSATISSITFNQLIEIDPLFEKKLNPQPREINPIKPIDIDSAFDEPYIDLVTRLEEIETLLKTVPPDPSSVLEYAYDKVLRDAEFSSYDHWLNVSHILAHQLLSLARMHTDQDPEVMYETFEMYFTNWSKPGISFKSEDDCIERFKRSYEETKTNPQPQMTLQTLRKLAWHMRFPVSDFPRVKMDQKGNIIGPDPISPLNYKFIQDRLEISLVEDVGCGQHYIKALPSIIKNYFSSGQMNSILSSNPRFSKAYDNNINNDQRLQDDLIVLYQDFGLHKTLRSHPILYKLRRSREQFDSFYEWVRGRDWDGTRRVDSILMRSLSFEPSYIPPDSSEEFVYGLVKRHLQIAIGLRAKADRERRGIFIEADRFKNAQSILILQGYQGTHKTTWIESLVPEGVPGLYTPAAGDEMKKSIELQRKLSNTFILNIDEVESMFELMSANNIKNIITQKRDNYREMYSENMHNNLRIASLFGTTNVTSLKLDKTGLRRFWIVPVSNCDARPLITCDYQQFWAELLHDVEQLDRWELNKEETAQVNAISGQYNKQTQAEKGIACTYSNEVMATPQEFDFKRLFREMKQVLKRQLVREGFLLVKSKAFRKAKGDTQLQEMDVVNINNFDYSMPIVSAKAMGLLNTTINCNKGFYKDGRFYYREGRNKQQEYYIFPQRNILLDLTKKELIPEDYWFPVSTEKPTSTKKKS